MIAILLALACYVEPEVQPVPTAEERCVAMCAPAGVASPHRGDAYDCVCRVAGEAR